MSGVHYFHGKASLRGQEPWASRFSALGPRSVLLDLLEFLIKLTS